MDYSEQEYGILTYTLSEGGHYQLGVIADGTLEQVLTACCKYIGKRLKVLDVRTLYSSEEGNGVSLIERFFENEQDLEDKSIYLMCKFPISSEDLTPLEPAERIRRIHRVQYLLDSFERGFEGFPHIRQKLEGKNIGVLALMTDEQYRNYLTRTSEGVREMTCSYSPSTFARLCEEMKTQ